MRRLQRRLYDIDGDDTMFGGNGTDIMTGGDGNDIYYVNNNADVVSEAAEQGYDIGYSTADTFTLADNIEALRLDAPGSTAVYAIGSSQDQHDHRQLR